MSRALLPRAALLEEMASVANGAHPHSATPLTGLRQHLGLWGLQHGWPEDAALLLLGLLARQPWEGSQWSRVSPGGAQRPTQPETWPRPCRLDRTGR